MKLKLKRFYFGEEYTIGKLFADGKYFCDTLEDKVRDLSQEEKVYGKTAIPEGTYEVIVNMSPRFKKMMPLLIDVPHFTGIRIHGGRNADDSLGCILVGFNKIKGGLVDGVSTSKKLTQMLTESQNRGEDISIEIC